MVLHFWHTSSSPGAFFEPNTVYLRFTCIAKHQPLFYIGSTEDHTLGREHTRYRKFKQVSSGQFVLSELAIRFWSHSNNFFWWSPVPIYIRRANHWALEHALIQLWQPKLNYPFISQFFIPRKGIISKIPYSNTRQFGIASLMAEKTIQVNWKSVEKRSQLSFVSKPSPHVDSSSRPWLQHQETIWTNSIHSQYSIQFGRMLCTTTTWSTPTWNPSKNGSPGYWLSNSFPKRKTCGQSSPFPCTLDALPTVGFSHPTNSTTLVFWNPTYCSPLSWAVLPFDLREAPLTDGCYLQSQRSYSKLVWWHCTYVYMLFAETVSFSQSLFPTSTVNTGYWMVLYWPLSYLIDLHKLLEALWITRSSQTKKNCNAYLWKLSINGRNRMRSHAPTTNGFFTSLLPFWPIIREESPTTLQQLLPANFKNSLANCIFHNEDKRASSLRIYCPCQYFECIDKTFLDSAIFARSHESPNDSLHITMQHLKNKFSQAYPWAMGRGTSLPSGYILPKGKKQYGSGRPIIGFFKAPFKPMLSTLAKLLFQLVPRACPDHFAKGDVYQLLQLLRNYAIAMGAKNLRLYNQDLSGFFISIDSDRFLQSWYMLLRFLEPLMSVHENEYFSISPVKQNNPGDIVKGRIFRTLNVNRHIRIGDVPELIIAALQMQNFQLGSKVYTQVQGSPMGSPFVSGFMLDGGFCLWTNLVSYPSWIHFQFTSTCTIFEIRGQSLGYPSFFY